MGAKGRPVEGDGRAHRQEGTRCARRGSDEQARVEAEGSPGWEVWDGNSVMACKAGTETEHD